MVETFNSPPLDRTSARARKQKPRFAFEHLEGGCFSEINLRRNTEEIREVQLPPSYLGDFPEHLIA